jgi:hypothetical protein
MGLFNSTVLEVAIGLVFVYLLLSILCTSANEWVAAMTRRRGEMLRKGIRQLLENQPIPGDSDPEGFLREFYKHPLISSMMHDKHHPTYLAPRTFAAVVTDILTATKPGSVEFADFENGGKGLSEGNVKKAVLALVQRSNKDLEVAQLAVEAWFNDAMDRVNGWYKRRTQLWTIIIALLLTLIANANTIHIVRRLGSDPVLRAAVVEEAKVRAQKPRPTISVEYKNEDDPTNPTITKNEGNELSKNEMDLLGQMLGWHGNVFVDKDRQSWSWDIWLERLIGWLLTVLAISLGAPFWFDMLNKFVNVRFAGRSPVEASKKPEKQDAKPIA